MIEEFFGFLRRPFGKDLPPASLYLTPHHRQILGRLERLVAHDGHAALTGEVGVGKSTLLRALLDRLPTSRTCCLYVGQNLPSRGILQKIAEDLGLSPYWLRADLIAQVQQAIGEQFDKAGRRTLLTVDDGHLMHVDVLEDSRSAPAYATQASELGSSSSLVAGLNKLVRSQTGAGARSWAPGTQPTLHR